MHTRLPRRFQRSTPQGPPRRTPWQVLLGVLRTSEERFRAAFQHAPIGMCLLDLQGRFRYANPAFCELVGYTDSELRPRSFLELTHAADREGDQAALAELRAGQREVYHTRTRYVHRDGHLVWAQVSAVLVRGAQGQPLHTLAQVLDISAQVRIERAQRVLAEAGLRLGAHLDAAVTATALAELVVPQLGDLCRVSLLDARGWVGTEALRATRPEAVEWMRGLTGPCPFDPAHLTPVVKVLLDGRTESVVVNEPYLQATLREEEQRVVARGLGLGHLVGLALRTRGRTVGTLLVGRSVEGGPFAADEILLFEGLAQRAALALDNGQLYQQAQHAIAARDHVLQVVAHDLRSPLNTISLAVTHLLRPAKASEAQRPLLDRVTRAVGRANRLIGDLLDAAQIELGHLRVTTAPYGPAELLQGAVEAQRLALDASGVAIAIEVEPGLCAVQADRDRFQQVIGNLLGNALKFTPPGGQVTVAARAAAGGVCFAVSDTGPGVAEADEAHLFTPFWKGREEDRRGAGLGLAIARGLVAAQGGRMWYERAPGGGAAFCFTLPVAP